ncbi:MAG: hypothetical protein COC23_03660 [Hyphomicrobiales bacterium]|nr:MAG: hypothetical protein COC23_03660 [Hyphomicrobiales bacterium]
MFINLIVNCDNSSKTKQMWQIYLQRSIADDSIAESIWLQTAIRNSTKRHKKTGELLPAGFYKLHWD